MPTLPSCLSRILTGSQLLVLAVVTNGQFTPGRLAILEMPFIPNGGGGFTIPTTGGQLVVREYAVDGTPGISVPFPSTGPNMLVSHFQSGGASLTRSPAGDKLVLTGFTATSDGSFTLATSTSAAVPRGIGTVDAQGLCARPFVTSTFFSGAPMTAACTDGVHYWAGGGNSGVCYLGPGTPAVINTDVAAVSDLQFLNGGLFRGVGSNGLQQVGSGSPVTPASQSTLFAMSLLQGFQISPAGDVIYANNASQVRKWVWNGSNWTNPYGFSAGTTLARIAVDWSGPQPIIYGVKNTPSSLVKFVDTGAPSAAVTLASTNAGAWYGITFTPGNDCTVGAACDDGNPNTGNDQIRDNCLCAGLSVLLNAKVFLDGAYIKSTGLMNDALRTLPDFPLTEPFTALGMAPSGGAGTISSGVLTVSGNDAVVDWVLVELRDAVSPAIVVMRTPALVQRDGDIVSLGGSGPLQLPVEPDVYRVAVRHRNHLGAMTNGTVALSNAAAAVDLTSAATATWGTGARKEIDGTQVLWSGEVVRNAQLKYSGSLNDRDPILTVVGGTTPNNVLTGYRIHDVTMNGFTSYTGTGNDRDPILVNVGSNTPNNVRVEQLP